MAGFTVPMAMAIGISTTAAGSRNGTRAHVTQLGNLHLNGGSALFKINQRVGHFGVRVSTPDQKPELQLKALKNAGCQKIFREKVSGFNRQRLEFQRMLDQIRPGDVIVVWKLDRLARSTRDLLSIAEFERDLIRERGVGREAAKQRGIRFGRPRKLDADQVKVGRAFAFRG
jgi:hypothetical protein